MHSNISKIMSARANIYVSSVKFRCWVYLTLYESIFPGLNYPRRIYNQLNFHIVVELKCEKNRPIQNYYFLLITGTTSNTTSRVTKVITIIFK